MKKTVTIRLLVVLISCFVTAACGSNGDNGTAAPGTGDLSLGLTDASTDRYRAVYVTIDEIQVHLGGDEEDAVNWETVAGPMKTYNLLELVNGVIEELGISPLEAGTYEKMQLIFGTVPTNGMNILGVGHPYANYVIAMDGRIHELNLPGDINSGIKIVHTFDVSEDQTTELILDFDAPASVVEAGTSGRWLLKPTIKVLDTPEHAIVRGTVYELVDSEPFGIEGARITLQYETPGAEDEKDAVTVQAATVSDEENQDEGIESGEFALLVEPGSYRLVSYKDGYDLGCALVEAAAGETTVQDVELTEAAMGRIEGNVSINGASIDQYATLSFRKPAPCGDAETLVEIRCVNNAYDYFYAVNLPVGTYSLVASSIDKETEVYDNIGVVEAGVTNLNVAIGF